MVWLLLACGAPAPSESTPLPGHSDCLAEGERMSDEVCAAVVEEDGRVPTVSHRSIDALPADPADPRLDDPDYAWLTSEIERCTCVCCHTASYGGPGVFEFDLEFEPVWIDSANNWTLQVLVGDTDDTLRTLPSTDPDRLRAVIEREFALRGE